MKYYYIYFQKTKSALDSKTFVYTILKYWQVVTSF